LSRIAEGEAKKEAAKALTDTAFTKAIQQYLGGMKTQRGSSLNAYRSTMRRLQRWADAQSIANVGDVTGQMLDRWRSEWSPEAKEKENRLALTTQAVLLTRVKAFFAWATSIRMIDHNPALAIKAITPGPSETMPLTAKQFELVLESTRKYDAECRYNAAKVGEQLRAIFLIQRWTGLRISDALVLPKPALVDNRIRLTTQKTEADMDCILPDHVVEVLNSLPRRKENTPTISSGRRDVPHRSKPISRFGR
jgi:site-specific recombinase XerD